VGGFFSPGEGERKETISKIGIIILKGIPQKKKGKVLIFHKIMEKGVGKKLPGLGACGGKKKKKKEGGA